MKTDKRNQHYVPKFYLRNFSYENNKKQIGIYNLNNGLFIPMAKLKTQASKNFFYGSDGIIEDNLSNIEGDLSTIIKNLIELKDVPLRDTPAHFKLLAFVTLTDLRNPVKIDGMKDTFAEMRRRLLELHPETDVEKLVPNPDHEELVKLHLSHAIEMGLMILDLDYKLLINNTSSPFITSDFPIVKYNQFLELKKWPHSKAGYGLTGLQIFIPVNHEIILVFYDKGIYKLGDKKKKIYAVTNPKDVDDINVLQFLNCFDTIFFDEKANEKYIRFLHDKSKKFKRANLTRSELSFLIKEGDENNRKTIEAGFKNFMKINKSDCETNLKIEGQSIHSKGKAYKLNDSLAQLRPHAARLREQNSR